MKTELKTTQNSTSEFRSRETIPVRFLHPNWWDVQDGGGGDPHFSVLISGIHEESCVGQIALQVFSLAEEPHVSPAEHIRRYSEKMKAAGYHLSGAPVLPCPSILGFDSGSISNPIASYDGHQFDAPILVSENNEYTVCLGLIGICQQESPEWWEVNKRVFELIRDSLRVGDAALAEFEEAEIDSVATNDVAVQSARNNFPDAGAVNRN